MARASFENQTALPGCPACLFAGPQTKCCDATSLGFASASILNLPTLITLLTIYVTVLQLLRYRRQHQITAFVAEHSPLTPESAQQVLHKIATLEFPAIHTVSLQFALFRTYGIPTISSLLRRTSLFSSPATAARRYADTGVLIGEFITRTYGSPDWVRPMARTNAIHGHYRDSGKILEADMLYTLLLFAQQPWKWIGKYEWRALTEQELDALGTFWRAIAEAMEIDYTGLQVPGWEEDEEAPMSANGRGRGAWKSGADWVRAVNEWADAYERKCMVPDESNAVVAEQTIALLLDDVPKPLHPLGRHVVSSLMDKRLRRAMRIADPPVAVHCTLHTILLVRKLVLRYLVPPRPAFMKVKRVTDLEERTAEGRHHFLDYDNVPYYVKPTFMHRWGLRAWMRWLAGKDLPGDEGMHPEGYFSDKVGPPAGRAPKEQAKREAMVEDVLAGRGCPMAFRR